MSRSTSVVWAGTALDPYRPSVDWLKRIRLTADASLLSNGKRRGAELLVRARHHAQLCEQRIEEGNAKSAVYHALGALQAFWRAEINEAESMIRHGVRAARSTEAQNAKSSAEAASRRSQWQQLANAIWSRHPDWSAFEVARQVERKVGDAKANYIRKHIKRPSQK